MAGVITTPPPNPASAPRKPAAAEIRPTSACLLYTSPSNQAQLDEDDLDFGSGGVLVLPDQPGPTPHLAVAAGKVGTMYLMNQDDLGGYSPENNVLGSYSIGGCWCGPSYFVDADGVARVVSSGGTQVMVWKVLTSPSVALQQVAESGGCLLYTSQKQS